MKHTLDCPCGRTDITGDRCSVCGTDLSPLRRLILIEEKENQKVRRYRRKIYILLPTVILLVLALIFLISSNNSSNDVASVQNSNEDNSIQGQIDDNASNDSDNKRSIKDVAVKIRKVFKESNIPYDIVIDVEGDKLIVSGNVSDDWIKDFVVMSIESYSNGYDIVSTELLIESNNVTEERIGTITIKYKIKKGDTLYRIAEAFLGDGESWGSIFEANRDTIENPDTLVVGQEITITINTEGDR